jgi:hypothetical protein
VIKKKTGQELASVNTNRQLVPKLASQLSSYQLSVQIQFESQEEWNYFQIFKEETSAELAGIFESCFWNRILLQDSHHLDFVRHAVIGIAALHKSL